MKRLSLLIFVMTVASSYVAANSLIVATSDYETANTAIYDLEDGNMRVNVLGHADQDVHVATHDGYVYFIESGLGAISKYKANNISRSGLIYQFSTGPASNPVKMVFTGGKAYVLCYNLGVLLVVNPDASKQSDFIIGEIDLSGFDDDGVPEMIDGFERNGELYIVLQRLDNWQADKQGLLAVIDIATGAPIDLDNDTQGIQGKELLIKNPWWCSQVGDEIYVSGHVWDGSLEQGAIAVDVSDPSLPQRMVISEAEMGKGVTGLTVFTSTLGLFNSTQWIQDADTSEWREIGSAYIFNPTTGVVGDAIPAPSPGGGAVLYDGVLHVGSRDNEHPGIYRIDALTNELLEYLSTDLPPVSMACVLDEVEENIAQPELIRLSPVFPNPFIPVANIEYSILRETRITIEVRDIAGRLVCTLADNRHIPGQYRIAWDAGSLASGMYFIRMSDGDSVLSMKAMLMK